MIHRERRMRTKQKEANKKKQMRQECVCVREREGEREGGEGEREGGERERKNEPDLISNVGDRLKPTIGETITVFLQKPDLPFLLRLGDINQMKTCKLVKTHRSVFFV